MKSKVKSKISLILITTGILLVFSPIISKDLKLNFGIREKSTEYGETINLDKEDVKISVVSGKIHIDNNWSDANNAGICTGSGTYSDPYVIEDLIIDGGGLGKGIWIENSVVYFKIENCNLYNFGIQSYVSGNYDSGIFLFNVSNGELIDNTVKNNHFGIYLEQSNSNNILGNIVNNNYGGIYLRNSNFNAISKNTANNNSENGINLSGSHNNFISGNTAYYNKWRGIVMGGLSGSHNNNISGNIANYNDHGIYLYSSNFNDISRNTISYNNGSGINLRYGTQNTIFANIINNNNETGIYSIFSSFNDIYLNCFNDNTLNAFDDGSNNHWDNGIKGNYWDDYIGLDGDSNGIGDTPYNITGSAGSQDNFPLMKCPISAQDGGGFPLELVIIISVISGGAVIGVAALLLIRRRRKRME